MRRGPGTAVAITLLAATLATAGCGLGPGEGVGQVSLTVTRDYGAEPVLAPASDEASEADSVMSVLERDADISTRYGGGFVQSIDGLEAQERFGRSFDWFFYVNGVESTVGAADYPLHGGEDVWWDYRDWSAAMRVPAVVGSWPRPFVDGYDGERRPVAVECMGPFNFSSGGISRGLVPQVRYRITNDRFNDQIILSAIEEKDGKEQIRRVMTLNEERISALRTLDFSVRGYVMRQRAVSQVFPSLGIGAEIGVHTRPGHTDSYSGTAYLYTYGYLPGIGPRQGLRLTASFETDLGCGGPYSCPEGALTAIPRGFVDSNLKSVLNTCSGSRMRVTADYAIPFLDVDWSFLSPIAYIKNFELTPFFDWSYQTFSHSPVLYYNPGGVTGEHLFSAGADLTVNLGNFFWLPYDTKAGIRYSRNFWHNLDYLPVSNLNANYFGWIFSVSL